RKHLRSLGYIDQPPRAQKGTRPPDRRASGWCAVRGQLVSAAAIALVTVLTYGQTVHGDFVSDDVQTVRDNQLIRRLDGPHVRAMLATFQGANYVPLVVLSLAIDSRLWGPAPFGFHVTNLLIHTLSALV